VIGWAGRLVAENDPAAGVDDKYSGQLQNIADGSADSGAPGHGRHCLDGNHRRKRSKNRQSLQMELPVKRLLGVGNHGEGDVEFLQKRRAFRRGSHTYQNDPGIGLIKIGFSGAQLRHLLAAKRSAEMPQEHNH
jgi:hypothetical protein